jgi:hypothetical protein
MRSLLSVLVILVVASACDCGSARLVGRLDAGCEPERCDGIDNDCNGEIDEGLPVVSCGVGICTRKVVSCVAGLPQECEPGSASVEICDGLDNDCNGEVDEALADVTCGSGACQQSARSCVDGALQACIPGAPTPEVCDSVDNDCNGAVDDGLPAVSCGVGACQRTIDACDGGVAQTCTAGIPAAEICDNEDNDCNGVIDDGFMRVTCGVGECARGVSSCTAGQVPTCQAGAPSTEVCDGVDNDCDGLVDEGLNATTCGQGSCARTIPACVNGVSQICTPGAPSIEVCDGLDNNCNGSIDEGFGSVSCGVGACVRTVATCAGGSSQMCTPGIPAPEVCDGLDNDCDGQTDEALGDLSCGTGACRRTVAACSSGAAQMCNPGSPVTETCDGIDNDCDGRIDQGLTALTCGVGACARSVPACLSGAPQRCSPGSPATETCDGLDNDCNAQTDEGVCLAPMVMCPGSISGILGTLFSLTGNASDIDGPIASTQWTVISRPPGSTAVPSSPASTTTSFAPDLTGSFILRFCATDGEGRTTCCDTALTTTSCTMPPPPPVSTACTTSWDGRPIVQFSAVPSGLVYELALAGSTAVIASAHSGQNYLRPALRVAAGAAPPGAVVPLEVRACRVSDPSCCSSASALSVNIVEACTTTIAPTTSNVVLSEYITNGEGSCGAGGTCDSCQAGESIEITNLSNCPVSLDGHHFAYRNSSASAGSSRWMNFGAADVIPPRGVYVAIRNPQFAPTCRATLPTPSTALYGLRISALAMQGLNLCSGWFNNTGGGASELRLAPGSVPAGGAPDFTPATALARIQGYLPSSGSFLACTSTGFDAVDSCGTILGGSEPLSQLSPNQLGRLWHPCDAVVSPVPACVRD